MGRVYNSYPNPPAELERSFQCWDHGAGSAFLHRSAHRDKVVLHVYNDQCRGLRVDLAYLICHVVSAGRCCRPCRLLMQMSISIATAEKDRHEASTRVVF